MSKKSRRPKACRVHEHGALAVCLLCLIAMGAALLTFSSGNSFSRAEIQQALTERDNAYFGIVQKVVEIEGRLNKKTGAK